MRGDKSVSMPLSTLRNLPEETNRRSRRRSAVKPPIALSTENKLIREIYQLTNKTVTVTF
jgi:hypothetical protein